MAVCVHILYRCSSVGCLCISIIVLLDKFRTMVSFGSHYTVELQKVPFIQKLYLQAERGITRKQVLSRQQLLFWVIMMP